MPIPNVLTFPKCENLYKVDPGLAGFKRPTKIPAVNPISSNGQECPFYVLIVGKDGFSPLLLHSEYAVFPLFITTFVRT
jgi:hypothetical protein